MVRLVGPKNTRTFQAELTSETDIPCNNTITPSPGSVYHPVPCHGVTHFNFSQKNFTESFLSLLTPDYCCCLPVWRFSYICGCHLKTDGCFFVFDWLVGFFVSFFACSSFWKERKGFGSLQANTKSWEAPKLVQRGKDQGDRTARQDRNTWLRWRN